MRALYKRIQSISHLSYLERLSILNLEPLELRRLKSDLIMYFKIFKGLTCIDPGTVFTLKQTNRTSSSRNKAHSLALFKPTKQLQVTTNSFFYRAIDAWNYLPESVISATSVSSFKTKLNFIDFKSFLHGRCFN